MEYVELGKTGLQVSQLVFGTLIMGPLQRDITAEVGSVVIRKGLEAGINFLDTAQLYGTYGHISQALQGFENDVIIASKSAVSKYEDMATAVEEAQAKLGRSVEIFLMHAVKNEEDLERRQGAWQCLLNLKKSGVIRAAGLSTHNLDIVDQVSEWPEIDVIHPIYNKLNFGLVNEHKKNPADVLKKTFLKGIGMYAMKPLAGGHLYKDLVSSLRYAFDFPFLHAVAIGMLTEQELMVNLKVYHNEVVSEEELQSARNDKRMYVIGFCTGCGSCLEACEHGAMSMDTQRASIEHSKCILCGYCRKACPHNMIRIV
ncbi:MAG TPA: aldo/keto reductase [Candidatus Limnocylindrales bacterium]|nr:aldo/keto reductase [Candidatus Limnocylindrales bacterium]